MTRIAEIADRLLRLAKRREDEGIYTDAALCEEAAELLSTPANPAQVTDAMVEAAIDAWENVYEAELHIGSPTYTDNKEVAMRAALTAAIGAGGQAVAVKPLEWYDPGNRIEYADTLLGSYKVNASGSWWLDNSAMEHCGSREAAKAAAQADFERRILSAIAHPVQPGWRDIPVTDEAVTYITQYGGRCRDCADAMGVCPTSGLPCDPHEARAAIRHVLRAVNYGFGEGFLSFPTAPQPKGSEMAGFDQPDFTYYECPECGFDCIHPASYECRSTACPLCAEDSGHDVGMRSRVAKTTDKPEGRDARVATAILTHGGRDEQR